MPNSKPEAKTAAKRHSRSKTSSAGAPPVAVVDQVTFEMLPKGSDLWVKNAARESEMIAQMRKGAKLVVKASSLRGHLSTDIYSLIGFSQAMDRLMKECPEKK